MSRYHISVDQILYSEAATEKSTNRRQLDTLVDDLTDTEIKILIAAAQPLEITLSDWLKMILPIVGGAIVTISAFLESNHHKS